MSSGFTWSDNLTRILVDLKFLANINEGDKPCFNKKIYVSSDSWYGSLLRFVYSESGRDAHIRTRNILHDAMDFHSRINNEEHRQVIAEHIQNAVKGLENLIKTYERVPEVLLNLQVLHTEATTWLQKMITP